MRSFLFGSTREQFRTDLLLLVLRVFTGLALALGHGLGKFPPGDKFIEIVAGLDFPYPVLLAWASVLTETVGGFCLAAGLFTRPVSLLITINMIVVVFLRAGGDILGQGELGSFYLVSAFIFLVLGAGRFSLDTLFRSRRYKR